MREPRVQRSRGYRWLRLAMKRFMYPQMAVINAGFEFLGLTDPLMHFIIEGSPPSLYLNFELSDDAVQELTREIRPPYPLTPIRVLADEEPFCCVTVNIYRVSGLVNGLRAEWSTFVSDPDGVARFCVIEARAAGLSLDSVELFTGPTPVDHAMTSGELRSEAKTDDGGWLRSTCSLQGSDAPAPDASPIAPEWVRANDYIYWLDGVCDRAYYDSSLAYPDAQILGPEQVTIEDTTRWAPFIKGTLRHAVVFNSSAPMVVSPWKNLHLTNASVRSSVRPGGLSHWLGHASPMRSE